MRHFALSSSILYVSLLWGTPVCRGFCPIVSPANKRSQHQLHVKVDKGFNLLELASGVIPQGRLVQTAKNVVQFVWKRLMTELAPQDPNGNYERPSYHKVAPTTNILLDTTIASDRYHLYVGNPCPWCHRCAIVVKILNLPVKMTRLKDDPIRASRGGWIFSSLEPDPLGSRDLRILYDTLIPGYKGRCTAPLLIDTVTRTLVSNESADIVRILIQLGKTITTTTMDLYPRELAKDIDETNQWVYEMLNNGVYKCGFATSQQAYDRASKDVREGLQRCDSILSQNEFLCGSQFTEADLRLLPTILRFDGVYSPLFRAGGAHLKIKSDYPSLFLWLQRCWAMPGVAESIDLPDACSSYYKQLFPLNPGGIVPSLVTPSSLELET
jgi:putative glutathione S-transferase